MTGSNSHKPSQETMGSKIKIFLLSWSGSRNSFHFWVCFPTSAAKVYLNQKITIQGVVFLTPLSSSLLPCPNPPPLTKVSLPPTSTLLPKKRKTKTSQLTLLFFNRIRFWGFGFDSCLYEVKTTQLFFFPSLKTWCFFGLVVKRRLMSSCFPNNKHFLFFFFCIQFLHWYCRITQPTGLDW